MSRFKRGYQLFRDGLVKCIYEDTEYAQFHVRSRSNKREKYLVEVYDDCVNCQCKDFYNRHQRKKDATFICQHIYGAFFQMASDVGLTSQAVFETQAERVERLLSEQGKGIL